LFFRLGDCLGVFFLGVPLIYGTYVLVFLFTGLCSSCAESRLLIKFAIQKKKIGEEESSVLHLTQLGMGGHHITSLIEGAFEG
jgi:hypothetical protein